VLNVFRCHKNARMDHLRIPLAFEPDARLANDSLWILDLQLCQLRLMQDKRFFWALLVPRIANAHEWFELSAGEQLLLHQETMQVARALKNAANAQKINIGALGNIVAQLHVHVVARSSSDACWPQPIWGTQMQTPAPELMAKRSAALLEALQNLR